jgi:hypothetical protein
MSGRSYMDKTLEQRADLDWFHFEQTSKLIAKCARVKPSTKFPDWGEYAMTSEITALGAVDEEISRLVSTALHDGKLLTGEVAHGLIADKFGERYFISIQTAFMSGVTKAA